MIDVSIVAGARPNFMKVAPIIGPLTRHLEVELIHTGQHYDREMSDDFFRDLGLPEPDLNLGVGSASHAEQTGNVLIAYGRHLETRRPRAVVVVGDVNSTLAAALAAAKLDIPVAHVEAGLRSHDWTMPEEINRVLTDRLSTWLFTPSADADENLGREGIDPARVHCVGNVMIDTLQRILPDARAALPALRAELDLPEEYAVLTLHRPANVDRSAARDEIVAAVAELSDEIEVVFPVHPRTRGQLDDARLAGSRVRLVTPLSYKRFLGLVDGARLVLTDSGGIQEETSVLGIPCLTLRATTERPVTCTLGTNQVVGTGRADILAAAQAARGLGRRPADIPLWDGKAGERIGAVLTAALAAR